MNTFKLKIQLNLNWGKMEILITANRQQLHDCRQTCISCSHFMFVMGLVNEGFRSVGYRKIYKT